jgi:hypothetical protein
MVGHSATMVIPVRPKWTFGALRNSAGVWIVASGPQLGLPGAEGDHNECFHGVPEAVGEQRNNLGLVAPSGLSHQPPGVPRQRRWSSGASHPMLAHTPMARPISKMAWRPSSEKERAGSASSGRMTTLPGFALSTKVVAKPSRGCLPVELSDERRSLEPTNRTLPQSPSPSHQEEDNAGQA